MADVHTKLPNRFFINVRAGDKTTLPDTPAATPGSAILQASHAATRRSADDQEVFPSP